MTIAVEKVHSSTRQHLQEVNATKEAVYKQILASILA
jgi:hypothetical protein